jgi:hypothetical protein
MAPPAHIRPHKKSIGVSLKIAFIPRERWQWFLPRGLLYLGVTSFFSTHTRCTSRLMLPEQGYSAQKAEKKARALYQRHIPRFISAFTWVCQSVSSCARGLSRTLISELLGLAFSQCPKINFSSRRYTPTCPHDAAVWNNAGNVNCKLIFTQWQIVVSEHRKKKSWDETETVYILSVSHFSVGCCDGRAF